MCDGLYRLSYKARVDMGICVRCLKPRAPGEPYARCTRCLKLNRQTNHRRLVRKKVNGVCLNCPALCQEDNVRCEPCATAHNKYNRDNGYGLKAKEAA